MEDSAILELYFRREEAAIRETERKYGARLLCVSKSITGSDPDAEECVNDTYLAAWNTIPPARPERFDAYLCRIVRNLSYNRFHANTAQKRNGNTVALDEELSELIPDPSAVVPEEADLGHAMDQFLRTLDTENRYLFLRRYFYADSLDALSAMTGITAASLAVRLMRIRKKLKVYLEKEGCFL